MNTIEGTVGTAIKTAMEIRAGLIIIYADFGYTASLVSKYRPSCPILVVTTNQNVVRHANSCYGQYTQLVDNIDESTEAAAIAFGLEKKYCEPGDPIIVIKGKQYTEGAARTPLLKVIKAPGWLGA